MVTEKFDEELQFEELQLEELRMISLRFEFAPEGQKNYYFLTNATKEQFRDLMVGWLAEKTGEQIYFDQTLFTPIREYVESQGFICFVRPVVSKLVSAD